MAAEDLWLFDTEGWQFHSKNGKLYYAEGVTPGYAHLQLAEIRKSIQPNCADQNCPKVGHIHEKTARCRPSEAAHDEYALRRVTKQMRAQPTRRPAQMP